MSSRLKGELIHPNETGSITNIKFSPDGKRILAGDNFGSVAFWDTASGQRLTTIQTASRSFGLAPDWRTVFATHEERHPEIVEQDGKRMIRWTFGGEVGVWSLDDGKLVRTYKRQPQTNVRHMTLSPDGKTFFTFDELPGIYEGGPEHVISLWDVESGTYRTLEGLRGRGLFSPDSKTVVFEIQGESGGYSQGLKLIDVATGCEKRSLLVADKNALTYVYAGAFSRDQRLLFGGMRIYDQPKKWDSWRLWMKWWDTETGREVASFECENNDFCLISLSPDGQRLAAVNDQADKRKLFLYNVQQKRLGWTIVVGEKTEEFRLYASNPVFTPDGKWMVVTTGHYPKTRSDGPLDPRDLPQPRMLLIETATGAIRETLIAPQSFSNAACFSPDSRTLATDGHGRVLLWDLTKMPE